MMMTVSMISGTVQRVRASLRLSSVDLCEGRTKFKLDDKKKGKDNYLIKCYLY